MVDGVCWRIVNYDFCLLEKLALENTAVEHTLNLDAVICWREILFIKNDKIRFCLEYREVGYVFFGFDFILVHNIVGDEKTADRQYNNGKHCGGYFNAEVLFLLFCLFGGLCIYGSLRLLCFNCRTAYRAESCFGSQFAWAYVTNTHLFSLLG